ncbi:hypothetical protein HPB47_007029 [Ixodes persulcatus]|uniref:Uncharacterized protein n=1 Tax=Ixodes persulcatus TaxID=34615 RepID=A0AC60P8J4_IXOPE|nr:hypothetical protein HPB47_007029 [Ixodes persulcatus]
MWTLVSQPRSAEAQFCSNTLDAILPELRVTADSQVFLQLEDKTQGRRTLVFYAEKNLDAMIRGCAFHFAKAINARQDELGLKTLCRDNPAVHAWFTRVRHLPFVPDAFRLEFASDLLSDNPSIQPVNAARLDQFERYFRGFWLTNSLLKDIWGQFGNRGARTTNNVEGWHNGLQSRLPSRHPDLAEFLQFLKSAQHAAQNRIQALLLDPLAVAQPQSHVIQTRNNKLHQEMDAFASFISSHPPTFVDVRNYIDRVASSGALPVSH